MRFRFLFCPLDKLVDGELEPDSRERFSSPPSSAVPFVVIFSIFPINNSLKIAAISFFREVSFFPGMFPFEDF